LPRGERRAFAKPGHELKQLRLGSLPSGDFAKDRYKQLIANVEYERKGVTDFDVHEILWICHRNA